MVEEKEREFWLRMNGSRRVKFRVRTHTTDLVDPNVNPINYMVCLTFSSVRVTSGFSSTPSSLVESFKQCKPFFVTGSKRKVLLLFPCNSLIFTV